MTKTPRKRPNEQPNKGQTFEAAKVKEKHKEAMAFARRSFREYAEAYKALAKS
jgi:hypothetical protein